MDIESTTTTAKSSPTGPAQTTPVETSSLYSGSDHPPTSAFNTNSSTESMPSKLHNTGLYHEGSLGSIEDTDDVHIQYDAKYTFRNGYFEKAKGLGWFVTGMFVVGDLAGGGIVALPLAFVQAGFATGMLLTIVMTVCVTYTATVLGRCWVIMQRLWPEYTEAHCRKPYPEMGYRALGPRWRNAVSICIDVTQFGVSVVYLLLVAKNTHDFLKAFFNTELSFCLIIIVVALLLLPVTFLKSPQDFWGAAVLAVITTSIAVGLIILGSVLDYPTCAPHRTVPPFDVANYFLALGTFIFSYGGHAAFPTIQHDMRRPHEFHKSSLLAFSIMAVMYVPVSIIGWATYGGSLGSSVINSLQVAWIQQVVNTLISLHCIVTITIVINPLTQEVEELLRVPHHFGWQRVLCRTSMMVAVVFVAESVPSFGPMLDLLGGSTFSLTSLIFPCLFYLYLSTVEKKARLAMESGKMAGSEIYTLAGNNNHFGGGKPIVPAAMLGLNGVGKGMNLNEDAYGAAQRKRSRPTLFAGNDLNERPSLVDILLHTDRFTLFACTFVIVLAVVGGGAATFSALREMSVMNYTPPCYIAVQPSSEGHTRCCGAGRNISRYGVETVDSFCSFTKD